MLGGVNVVFWPDAGETEPPLVDHATPLTLPLSVVLPLLHIAEGGDVIEFWLSTLTTAVAAGHAPLVALIVTFTLCTGGLTVGTVNVVFCPVDGETEPVEELQLMPGTLPLIATVPAALHTAAGGDTMLFTSSILIVAVAALHTPLVALTVIVVFCVGGAIEGNVNVEFWPDAGLNEPAEVVQLTPLTLPEIVAVAELLHNAVGGLLMLLRSSTLIVLFAVHVPLTAVIDIVAFWVGGVIVPGVNVVFAPLVGLTVPELTLQLTLTLLLSAAVKLLHVAVGIVNIG